MILLIIMTNLRVAVLICTKDRPDFMIRLLTYYADLESFHPIYIADSSNNHHAEILKKTIEKFKNKISVKYTWYPPGPDNHGALLEQVKEKYACVCSDDDYQIPNSLTKCADFLNKNPNYTAASGYSVSFRLKKGGAYGELQRLADYPRYSIESESAQQRVIDFTKVIYSITFFVNRVENIQKAWGSKLYMAQTMNELISWNHCIIPGKTKVIDCLSLVRQIHDRQYPMPNSFEWMTSKYFFNDYELFKSEISKAIAEKDNIDIKTAEEAAKEAHWHYMQKTLASDYKTYLLQKYPPLNKPGESFRILVSSSFPIIKKFYRNYIKPLIKNNNLQLHYEVLQPSSKYYQDFKPVLDSFTGSVPKNL